MNRLKDVPPVFIVGPVRSGSTLLRLMLDSHPQIRNPGECDFLFDMVGDQGEFPSISNYIKWLSTNRIFNAKHLIANPELSYQSLMQSFMRQFGPEDAVLTMNVHRHFHRIPYVFPKARYVHLLRDPRDVARSCIEMGWVGHVYYGVDVWSRAEESWQRLQSRLPPESYLEIRYEDLVADVRSGLSSICTFLGVEFSEQMMCYASNSTYQLPDRRLIYQWKTKYTKRELQLVEGKLGEQITRLGYVSSELAPVTPGLLEFAGLYLRNKSYRVRYQIGKYGLSLYAENLVASKLGFGSWQENCQRRKNQIDIEHLK